MSSRRKSGMKIGARIAHLAMAAGMMKFTSAVMSMNPIRSHTAPMFAPSAGAIVILRVLTVDDCYRAISWTTVILVGGMIPLSTAMTQTGAAGKLADRLVSIVGDSGPHALLIGLFVLTVALGQLISNMATALIVIPIAVSAAGDMDVSAKPVLMC